MKSSNRGKGAFHHILICKFAWKFLAKQNMYFYNSNEDSEEGEPSNVFRLLKLLSYFDPVLGELFESIKRGNLSDKRRLMSCLSRQSELIHLLENDLREKIVADIQKAGYFGILFDTTIDARQEDQLCEVIRYAHIEDGKVAVKELFLSCFHVCRRTAAELAESVLKQLDSDGLDINLCRGQGYDNMADICVDIQATIKGINPTALFVPCANHSLNLGLFHSFRRVDLCLLSLSGPSEDIYSFCLAAPKLEMLQEVGIPVEILHSVKNGRKTRWSVREEAVQAVKTKFEKLVSTSEELCEPNYLAVVRASA